MKLSVRNFRRVERADLEGGPVILIGGRNNNGKSSVLQAAAVAVTGWALPPGRLKKDAARLIRRGADKASITGFIGDGAVKVAYPEAKAVFEPEGSVRVSTIAAGLHKFTELKPDEMAGVLGPHIGAEPTLSDILDACRDASLSAELAGKVWSKIEEVGWAKTEQQAKEQGIKLKGIWEQRTGAKKWGVKVGAEWRPRGWDDALIGVVIEEADVVALRQRLQTAREMAAVESSEIERLTNAAATLGAGNKAHAEAVAAQMQAEVALATAKQALAALPRPDAPGGGMPCPHCGGFLKLKHLSDGVTELVMDHQEAISTADLENQRRAIAEASGTVANREVALGTAKAAAIDAQVAVTQAKNAATQLAAAQAKGGGEDVAALTTELAELEGKFLAIENNKAAANSHAAILQNAALQELLSPDGVRRTVMNRGLDRFNNETLAPLCAKAGWPPVRVTPEMGIVWGDDDWSDLGNSSRWIVDKILQVAIAAKDGSQLVIMDEADICDSGNRNKLFGLLMKQPFETLVGMTFNKPELMPDLPAAKAGTRFWIANGIAQGV